MMTPLPRQFKKFQKQAEEWLLLGRVKDTEFSGSTYQILVNDPLEIKGEWAFIQLDEQGRLKDSFCQCVQSEEGQPCLHQAIAYLYIYHGHDMPLHKRFEKSFWNTLFRQCVEDFGDEPKILKKVGSGHFCRMERGRLLFSIETHNPETTARLESLLFEREAETEETSLKFSNLTSEEILQWERGRPSPKLVYELSFWSDLAKWLMEMQEGESSYTIVFDEQTKKLPKSITISFSGLKITRSLTRESLEELIPTLATVEASLKIHDAWKEAIEKIDYDKDKACFLITPRRHLEGLDHRLDKMQAQTIGEWAYVEGDGFYSKQTHFLDNIHEFYDVEAILEEHAQDLKRLLNGLVVKETPSSVSYEVAFDAKWNLQIDSYLFSPGDLLAPLSKGFGAWAYVDGRGFYRIERREFTDFSVTIRANEVGDFITSHRPWLNTLKGFHTHLTPLEANLNFKFDKNNLIFSRQIAHHDKKTPTKEFGRWVYVENHGFFSKVTNQSVMALKAGMSIPHDQIPSFIRYNRDDLGLISGFFTDKCPVLKSELTIELTSDDRISVTPKYTFSEEYEGKEVKLFDDYTYVDGEGFCEIPHQNRLPEGFCLPTLIDEDDLPDFITVVLPKLMPLAAFVDPRLRKPSERRLVADQIERLEAKGKEGYGVRLNFETEFGTISISSLWAAFKQNRRYVFSEAGLFDLQEDPFNWIRSLQKGSVDKKKQSITLSTLELMRLNAVEGISEDTDNKVVSDTLRSITEMRTPDDPDLNGLKSNLRSYQLLGVRWLWFLYSHSLSGLLCDDMGLGKTHQTMALLAAIANTKKGKCHHLVVCPTSVIYHWQEKLQEYLPHLKVWTFYGINRSLDDFYESSDILLTSYGIWRNEIDKLSKMHFEVAIFDELQIAKNHTSRIYKSLLKVKARMRLGLTGTPIENRLRELKTLFDIVLPGYMPSEADYRETFVRPIERDFNMEAKVLLSRLIKPFVTRRKKEDVLLDLPEKIEEISHCDLLPEQATLYAEVLTASRDKLIEELSDEGAAVPYLHVFSLLSKLKQVCDHPAVYLKKPEEYQNYQSGKWDLFVELLEEARQSQQKVVVFSQYLAMLDIIELHLKSEKIGYAAIRGNTTNRGEQIRRFNKDPDCEVFVASIQAVGLGVDLTAASVVIHYDRWWNAARENQATDRVHRIGQTRGVQVFKLMTLGTLEEHIDFLITKKSRLMEEVVTADDHEIVKKFDRSEIISILQLMPKGKQE